MLFRARLAQSGVKFVPKPEQENYNKEIMSFLNYLISLLRSRDYSHITDSDLTFELKLPAEKKLSPKERNSNLPLAKRFEKDMKSLFGLIENELQVYEMNQYDPKGYEDEEEV